MIGQLALVALYNWWCGYNRIDEVEKKDFSGRTNFVSSVRYLLYVLAFWRAGEQACVYIQRVGLGVSEWRKSNLLGFHKH